MPLSKITAASISDGTVVAADIANGAITNPKLATGAVTGDKIGLTAINANNIVDASITGAKLAANTITGDVIGQNAVSSNNIIASVTLTTPTISGNTTFDTNTLFVDATNDRVGIGTTNPEYKLTLAGYSNADAENKFAIGTIAAYQALFYYNNGDEVFTVENTTDYANGGIAFRVNGANRGFFDINGNFQFNSGYGSAATAYGVRAWVNFNGSNGSINGSGGVSSVTRNGTGDYTVAYSFTFPSNTYTLWGMGRRNSSAQRPVLLCMNNSFYENTTTGARFYTMLNDSATIEDPIQFWFGAIR